MAERLTWSARALATVGLVALGAASALAITAEAEPDLTQAVADDQLVVPVVEAVSDGRLEVSVELTWQQGRVLRAPAGWEGIVTSVAPQPDGMVREGDRPLAIDGIERIALATTAPLVNPIGLGTVGSDVVELRDALARIGLLPMNTGGSRPERADRELIRALAALGTSLHVPDGALQFDPSWLIWMSEPAMPTEVLLEVGEAAPPAGAAIASEPVRLTSAVISQDPPPGGGQFHVSIDGFDPVAIDGRSVISAELPDLGERLLASGVDPASNDLRSALVSRVEPIQVLRVQASAIGAVGGRTCVWLSDGTTVRVEVVASQLGVSDLVPVPDLDGASNVVAFPSTELRELC